MNPTTAMMHCSISPSYHHNYVVHFQNKPMVFNRKLAPFVQKLLENDNHTPYHLNRTGIGLSHSVSLKADFGLVMKFYATGRLPQEIIDDLQTSDQSLVRKLENISDYHSLNLLKNVLYVASEKNLDLREENCLALFDQLELCALQQDSQEFVRLLCARGIDVEHVTLLNQVYQMMTYFDADSFSNVLKSFKTKCSPRFYQEALRVYLRTYPDQLIELIHLIQEPELKAELIGLIADSVIQTMFFKELTLQFTDICQKQSIQEITEEENCVESNPYTHISPSLVISQNPLHLTHHQKESLYSDLRGVFADSKEASPLSDHLIDENGLEKLAEAIVEKLRRRDVNKNERWGKHVILLLTQLIMEFYIHDDFFHPAFMQDLESLKNWIIPLQTLLKKVFQELDLELNKEETFLLDEIFIERELISAACGLFQKQHSIKQEFILQYTAKKLQPFFFQPFSFDLLQKEFSLKDLQENLENASLSPVLNQDDIFIFVRTYIKKRKELLYCTKTNIALKKELGALIPADYLTHISVEVLSNFGGSTRVVGDLWKTVIEEAPLILHTNSPERFIQNLFFRLLPHTSFSADELNENLFQGIRAFLNSRYNSEWTKFLVLDVVNMVRAYTLQLAKRSIYYSLNRTCSISSLEKRFFYPGFATDDRFLHAICEQASNLQKKVLQSSVLSPLIADCEDQFTQSATFAYLVQSTNQMFKSKSPKEEFFIRELIQYLPRLEAAEQPQDLPVSKFLSHIETELIKNQWGESLTGEDLVFIIRAWIRKIIEKENNKLAKPINLYQNLNKVAEDMQIVDNIQKKLQPVFKLLLANYGSRLPQELRWVTGGAVLKREIIMQVNHEIIRKRLLMNLYTIKSEK